jgi:hypothetical protein
MKLTCDVRALHGALSACAEITPTKTTLPALQHALLFAGVDGLLRVFATDLVLRVERILPATIEEPGDVQVPARYCAKWLGEVADLGCPIELELSDGRLHWRTGPFLLRTNFLGDMTDYPEVASPIRGAPQLAVDPGALASVAPSLLEVARGREGRVHVTIRAGRVTLYAMNDLHAAVAVLRNHGEPWLSDRLPPPWDNSWPITGRALAALAVSKDDADCTQLARDESAHVVVLSRPGVEVVANLDAYEKPVPAVADIANDLLADSPDTTCALEMDRDDLHGVFEAAALLATPAEMCYEPTRCMLEVRAQRNDERISGDARSEAPVLRGPPDKFSVTLDCGRLPRLIASLPGPTLLLELSNIVGGPAVRLRPVQELPDGARVGHVVRTRGEVRGAASTETVRAA